MRGKFQHQAARLESWRSRSAAPKMRIPASGSPLGVLALPQRSAQPLLRAPERLLAHLQLHLHHMQRLLSTFTIPAILAIPGIPAYPCDP